MTFEATALTRMRRIAAFLLSPLLKGMIKMCAKDLDDIKASIEAEAGAAAQGG